VTTKSRAGWLGTRTGSELDHCTISQLRTLLRLAVAPGERATSLPAEAGDMADLKRLLTDLLPAEAESGRVLLELVSERDTPVDALRRVKELGKRLIADAPSGAHRNAARVLYHAAIAAGYAGAGVNLSSRSIASRLPLYEDLASVLVGQTLGAVFRKAAERAARADRGSGEQNQQAGE
jgi:hypothetical protein